MHDDCFLNALPQYVIDLRAWMSDWYDHAFKAGFVRSPFRLDESIAGRLEGYFKAGLDALAEGADRVFWLGALKGQWMQPEDFDLRLTRMLHSLPAGTIAELADCWIAWWDGARTMYA